MKFGDGSFIIGGKKPLASRAVQIQSTGEQQKTLSPVKPKKKPGEFNITWPPMPIQQAKDYKVITTANELIKYLKRCEEKGICGFDYETTVTDEYRAIWAVKEREFASEIDRINDEYQCEMDTLDRLDPTSSTTFKKLDKERDKELGAVNKAYEKAASADFLRAPLDPWKSEICTVSLSAAPHEARVVFIGNPGANQYKLNVNNIKENMEYKSGSSFMLPSDYADLVRKEVFEILNKHLFQNRKITKVAVNLSFETKQTTKLGMYIMEPVADPLIMWVRCMQVVAPQKILDVKRPATGKGLKPMTWEYFGVKMGNFEELLKKHGVQFFSEISADHQDALIYSAEDSDYAVQHYLYWREIAKQIPMYDDWLHNIEMPFTRVIGLMEYWGMAWDDDLAEQKRQEAENIRDAAITEMVKIAKEQFDYDLDTGKTGKTGSVQYFLFDVLGAPIAKVSDKTDRPSLDEESLIDMRFMLENKLHDIKEEKYLAVELPEDWETRDVSSDPDFGKDERAAVRVKQRPDYEHKETALRFIDLIQTVQTYTTLISSHIIGRQKYINPISRRIHAGYTQWTETSRLNSQSPNQQNVSRDPIGSINVRNFYEAPSGKILFFIDFSGFELRLMAWASKDETMIDAFLHGGDLHRKTAATMTGKPESEITKAERTNAKAGNFGCNYGGGPHALQKTLKTQNGIRKTLAECDHIVQSVMGTYKRIPEYQRDSTLFARENGYVQTIYGYIRMLPNINTSNNTLRGSDERRAGNTRIQGGAADIMKKCQNAVYEEIGKSDILQHGKTDMVGQIHDEIILEMDDDPLLVEKAGNFIKALMEQPPIPDFPVPIIAEASVGYRWGEKMSLEKWLETKRGDQH